MDQVARKSVSSAFSLVEILVVIAILAILMAITVPSFSAVSGQAIEQAGQLSAQTLALARDMALTRNKRIEVRVIKTPSSGGTETFRTLQIWQRQDDGTSVSVSRITHLPQAISFAEAASLSPLLQSSAALSGTMQIGGVNRNYYGILLQPDGSPDKSTLGSNASCLTIVSERDRAASSLPSNFRALHINPITGEVRILRP